MFGAVSPQVGAGNVLMALEMSRNDGPWELPDDMRKVNAVVRYSQGNVQNAFSITGMGYSADWNATTDQIPLRAVETRGLSRFGNIDPTDAGPGPPATAWRSTGCNRAGRDRPASRPIPCRAG